MVLLQTNLNLFQEPDPRTTYIAIGILAGIIGGALLWSFITNRLRLSSNPSRAGRFGFRRRAKRAGLFKSHIQYLERVAKSQEITSPVKLLDGGSFLNGVIRNELEEIQAADLSEADKENRKNLLFQIKTIVDSNRQSTNVIASSRNIRIGQELKFILEGGGGPYETQVVSNLANMLGVEIPYNASDEPIRPAKGTRAQLTFVRDSTRVYRFVTRVRGLHTIRGRGALFFDHATDIKEVQKRKSPRKEYGRPAYFYPVQIVETGSGRKRTREAVVQKSRNYLGRVEDISAGGCRLRSQRPLKKGTLVKVEFQSDQRTPISVFGKVQSVEAAPPVGGDMHIMFTKISRKHLNEILSFVYGFSD